MRFYKPILLLLGITTFAYANTNSLSCNSKDQQAITTVTKAYVNQYTALRSGEIELIDLQCKNNFAKGKIHPLKPVTDDAFVYLKKEKNKWSVMTIGTGLDADLVKKVPKELR